MSLNLRVDEVLTTTRSVRKRLDFDKPVSHELLMECLELALQAPSGSNSQGWQWIFVEDAAKKKALGDIYLANATTYLGTETVNPYAEGDIRGERIELVADSARYLAEHMHEAPVLLVPCLEGSVTVMNQMSATFWGSLLPAVWSFCLALRSRGLGSCWTTLHLAGEGERKAAEILEIPNERYRQAGMFPIAYTKGTDFKRAKRLRAEELTHWDTW
jgi:nitroreductase